MTDRIPMREKTPCHEDSPDLEIEHEPPSPLDSTITSRKFVARDKAAPTVFVNCALLNTINSPGFESQPPKSTSSNPFTYFPFIHSRSRIEGPLRSARRLLISKEGCHEIDLNMSHIANLDRFCAEIQTYASPIKWINTTDIVTKARYTIHLEAWIEDKDERRIAWPVRGSKTIPDKPMVVELIVSWEANPEVMKSKKSWDNVVHILRKATRLFGEDGRLRSEKEMSFVDGKLGNVCVESFEWLREKRYIVIKR